MWSMAPDEVSDDTRPKLICVGEVARRLGINPETARRWSVKGLIPHTTTLSGRRRYDPRIIDALADGTWHSASMD
jgi:MerR family regulatory protein